MGFAVPKKSRIATPRSSRDVGAIVIGALALSAATGCAESNGVAEATRASSASVGPCAQGARGLGARAVGGDAGKSIPTELARGRFVLTIDDGPGPYSVELAHWLKERNVRATFFVNGHWLGVPRPGESATYAQVVAEIAREHDIGNHGFFHTMPWASDYAFLRPDFFSRKPGGISEREALHLRHKHSTATHRRTWEVLTTSGRIERALGGASAWPFRPFRAPGAYDTATSERVRASVDTRENGQLVGPVGWDIPRSRGATGTTADWQCWQQGLSVSACFQHYRAAMDAEGAGIILVHERTMESVELTRLLVGYVNGTVDAQGRPATPPAQARGAFVPLSSVGPLAKQAQRNAACVR